MSDSFADLWSSSAPLPPKSKPQTLSSVSASSSSSASGTASTSTFSRQNSNSGKPDVFALLSSSGTSTPAARYGSGLGNGSGSGMGNGGSSASYINTLGGKPSNPPSRTMTPSTSTLGAGLGAGVSRSGSAAGGSANAGGRGGGGDAFSDLFSSSNSSSNSSGNKTMTLAARLAMEAEQRRAGVGVGRASPAGSFGSVGPQGGGVGVGGGGDDAWAGLDSLAAGSSLVKPTSVSASSSQAKPGGKSVRADDEDDWGLADFGAAKPAAAVPSSMSNSNRTQTRTRTQTTAQSIADAAVAGKKEERERKGVSLWDLDEFAGSSTSTSTSTARSAQSQSQSPANGGSSSSSSTQNPQKPRNGGLFLDDDDDAGVTSPDVDFDFGSREDRDVGVGRAQKGLLDLDEDDHSYGRVGGMGRGLLDDHDHEEFGLGGAGERGNGEVRGNGGGHGGEDDDDILGMLSKPVEVVRARVGESATQPTRGTSNPSSTTHTANANATTQNKRRPTASPPPHILGQLVEMGFSVSQAKKALGETRDGMDVQAALEGLLGGGGGAGAAAAEEGRFVDSSSSSSGVGVGAAQPPAAPAPRTRGAPKGQKERERERLERARLASSSPSSSSQPSASDIQEQADKLLAQASEIGRGVFSKASAFWKEGKERVVKAYEERSVEGMGVGGAGERLAPGARSRGAGGARGRGRAGGEAGGGRPKWMQEVVHAEDGDGEEDGFGRGAGGVGFKDGWEREKERERERTRGGEVLDHAVANVEQEEVDLFSDAGVEVSSQDKPPTRDVRMQGQRPVQGSSSSRPPAPQRTNTNTRAHTRTPIPIPTRTLTPASPSSLALALKHKTLGTEQFKLGQFAAAAESYTAALGALPEGHLLRVPLWTNRAVARLRCGEYKGAVEDCERGVEGVFGRGVFGAEGDKTVAVESEFGVEDPLASKSKTKSKIIPPPLLHPSLLPPALVSAGRAKANEGGWKHSEGVGVDLLDCYVKALRRAAEGCEGRERWEEAGVWWGVLSRAGEGGGEQGWVDEKARKEAVVGGVRCRKMIDAASAGGASSMGEEKPKPAVKPKPKTQPRPPPKTVASSSGAPSRAVLALQSSNAQAEADDAARHALKDSVDARLSSWKSGKEANIRALLASLEGVLGEEGAKGLKMGMADLVSGAQVKKGYVRAIGRVHPDKLNAGNSTLEQRMLANGVFGGLNEAWIAFQAGQK